MIRMDESSRQSIEEIESHLGHATGIGAIDRGECPCYAITPIACTFCSYGHMLDCHYPKTCEEAQCDHYSDVQEEQ